MRHGEGDLSLHTLPAVYRQVQLCTLLWPEWAFAQCGYLPALKHIP